MGDEAKRKRDKAAVVLVAGVAGVVVTCGVYYPGVMSSDSLSAYRQALSGTIEGSTKTPMLAFLWMWILEVIPSPAGPLLFQNLLFWTGLMMIAAVCRVGTVTSVLAVLGIGLFPTVFALLGTLWSDVLLAVALTLFVGLVLTGVTQRSRGVLLFSIVPLFCGLSARPNALLAVMPLTAWLVVSWLGLEGRRIRVRQLVTCVALLLAVLIAAGMLFERAVITIGSGASARALQFSFLHDLAGMAVQTGDLRLPARVYRAVPGLNLKVIRELYDPADVNRLIYSGRWEPSAFLTTDNAEFLELIRIWGRAVRAHPGAYLRRRAEAVSAGFQVRGVYYPFHTGIDPNDLGLRFVRGPVYEGITRWLLNYNGVFFRGWSFAVVASLVVAVGAKLRRWSAVAVCTSGLLYVMPMAVITTGADFRYIWWLVVSTLIGFLLFVGDPLSRHSDCCEGSLE